MRSSLRTRVERLEQRRSAEPVTATAAPWTPTAEEAGAVFDVLADVLQDEDELVGVLLGQAEGLGLDDAAGYLRKVADSRPAGNASLSELIGDAE